MASSTMEPAIGIYLGTEYSCVGVWRDGCVEIIPNEQGNMTTPSCVAFTPERELIGEAAEIQADRNPTNTIFDMNRLIGRRFSDPAIQSNIKLWPFNVIEGAGDKPKIVVQYRGEEKQLFPEKLSAMILAKMKEMAQNFLNSNVCDAVVTVPAYFNDSQRRATRDAGAIAGLNVMCIMDEPAAAAVAYSFILNNEFLRNVLVFDLGINTFDVSVVEHNKGEFMVKATAGDTHLGGKDFDNRLLNYSLQEIMRKHHKDISDNPRSIRSLRSACEQAKKALSFAIFATVDVDGLYEGIDFSLIISRAQFDEINMDLFERCMGLVTKCLEDAHIKNTDIDRVVLVGGNTQIPMVQIMLQELLDGKVLLQSIDLNSVVAYGAALHSMMWKCCTPPIEAPREIGNAMQETVALQREHLEAQKLTEKLMYERDDGKKLTQQLMSERDETKQHSEAAQKLTEKLMSERDDAKKHLEAVQKLTEQLTFERDDAIKHSDAAQKLTGQLMSERDDAKKHSEAAQKLTEKLMSERDDAKKYSEAAQKLTKQLMSERDDAIKHSEAAQKLTEQLMYERDDAKKHSVVAEKLTEKLMSERDDAKKHSEAAHKLTEQLMSEMDEAKKQLEVAQELTEQLMSERDDGKKHLEANQKLIEQLISQRDNAIKQVEELLWLREQQAPAGSKSVGCFIEYSYSELRHATDNFHESVKLGEGGFGKVYKGILHNTTIAIKILNEESKQGAQGFHQEVEVLSKLEHPNLVKLIGACAEIHALIYEYLPNGSLEDRLRCKNNTSPLSWQARVRIAFEICDALSFLHCTKPHGIVHGDLKPDNILLDLNNVSKLSDFSLCRQLNRTTNASQPFHITGCPKGTFGYIDPEYFTTGKMTPQNDVYSFGIMLLQLVTCKDPLGIRQSVEEEHRKGTLKESIDVSAGPWPFKEAEKMISLGLRCCDIMSINRPDLSTVVLKEMKSMADVAFASQSSSWIASLFRR